MKEKAPAEPPKITKKLAIFGTIFVLGCMIEFFGFQNRIDITFQATNDNSINYRVFLKENDFFDEPYLESGKTYITSLIDHIDIDYHYSEEFSDVASGELSYYLQATISADKTSDLDNPDSYWTKTYQLTEPRTIVFDNSNQASFNISTSINYAHYDSILESFREKYPVASEGSLKVSLIVDNNLNTDSFNDPLTFKAESNISLPLLERAIEAKVNVNTGNRTQDFSISKKNHSPIYVIAKIIGIIVIVGAIVLIVREIIKQRSYVNHNQYTTLLDKILEANDSIITNIEKIPNLRKFQKFEVETFDELLDAYNEIRLPINFYQNKSGTSSTFFIASDKIVWIYRLKKRNLGS